MKIQDDKSTKFDFEVKSMLFDAEEEVPSGVWDALSKELDSRERRKPVVLWWRRAVSGVAAAAVLAGIFIAINQHKDQTRNFEQNIMVAEAPSASAVEKLMADIPIPEAAVTKKTYQGINPIITEVSESTRIVESLKETDSPISENVAVEPASQKAERVESVSTIEDDGWDALMAALDAEDARNRKSDRSIKLTIGGNTANNDKEGSLTSGPNRTPGSYVQEGIIEQSTSTFGIPMSIGISARVNLNDRISVGSGINYSLLSRTFNGIYNVVDKGGNLTRSVSASIQNELHYIGIPLNIYYTIRESKDMTFYTWGGTSIEKGLANSNRIMCKPEHITVTDKVKGVQTSAALGLGLDFVITDRLGIYMDPSARYYFDCDQPNSVRTQKPFMFNFEIGLRFNIR